MRISVVMIFHNPGAYFAEAIESVLAQEYDGWELVMVDDGSTDGSGELARNYQARDPRRVRVLSHPGGANRGMSASRNLGVAEARGNLVTFLDADDVLLPGALGREVAALDAQPEAGMAVASTLYWFSWTGSTADKVRDARDLGPGSGLPPDLLLRPPALLARLLADPRSVPCVCGLVIRRAAYRAIGGFEESFRGLYEDQAFYAKIALATPVYVANDCWAKYRQHPQSSCAVGRRSGRALEAQARYLAWLEAYLTSRRIDDTAIFTSLRERRAQLRRAFWSRRHPALYGLARGAWRLLRTRPTADL